MAGSRLVGQGEAEVSSIAQSHVLALDDHTCKSPPTLHSVRLSSGFLNCLRPQTVIYSILLPLICLTFFLAYSQSSSWLVHLDQKAGFYESVADKKRVLPHCIIIGVRKCGTRALLEFLNIHPLVEAARDEKHFFDKDDRYKLGLDWYRGQMPLILPEQIAIEKSPAYFITESVPARIRHMNSSIKLLLIVRDPAVRTISDYTQIYSNRLARNQTYPKFRSLVIDDTTGSINTDYKAVQISLYDIHLSRWLKVFPRDQLHIVDGDQLVANPVSELQKVETFLGINHFLTEDKFYFNKTRGFYCMRNDTVLKCLGSSKGRKHPYVDPVTQKTMRDFFRPHNQAFFNLTGVTFNWS